jgi:cell division septum initiation protein DivIVA
MSKKDDQDIHSGGGPVFMGNVVNRGTITGRSDTYHSGLNADEAARLFDNLFATIERHSALAVEDKADLRTEIEELRQELGKKEKANESFLMRRLRNIARMAPDILEVTLATITHPAAGFGLIAKKIADKIKASAE